MKLDTVVVLVLDLGFILCEIVRLIGRGSFVLAGQRFKVLVLKVFVSSASQSGLENSPLNNKQDKNDLIIPKLAKKSPAFAIVESPPSFGTFFPFGRPPPQAAPVGGPAATMDLTTAYRYNQNMMEYYTCKSECQS